MKCFKCGVEIGNNIDRLCPKCSSEFTRYYDPDAAAASDLSNKLPPNQPSDGEGISVPQKTNPEVLFSEDMLDEGLGPLPKINLPFSKQTASTNDPNVVRLDEEARPVPENPLPVSPEVKVISNAVEPPKPPPTPESVETPPKVEAVKEPEQAPLPEEKPEEKLPPENLKEEPQIEESKVVEESVIPKFLEEIPELPSPSEDKPMAPEAPAAGLPENVSVPNLTEPPQPEKITPGELPTEESFPPPPVAPNPPTKMMSSLPETVGEPTDSAESPPPPPPLTPPLPVDSASGGSSGFGAAKSFLSLMVAIFIFVFLSGSSLVVASYTNIKIPLLPDSISRTADALIASTPLVPKTAKQIFTKVLSSSSKQESFNQSLKFQLQTTSGEPALDNLEVGFTLRGPFDATDIENIKFSAKLDGYIKSPSFTDSVGLEMKELNNVFYFNLREIPNSYGAYLSSGMKDQWFRVPLSSQVASLGLTESAIEEFDSSKEVQKMLSGMLEVIEKYKVLEQMERKSDEKVGETDSYRFLYVPKNEILEELFKEYLASLYKSLGNSSYSQESLDKSAKDLVQSIKKFEVGLWVDKTNFFVNKTSIDLEYEIPSQSSEKFGISEMPPTIIALNFEYALASMNEPQAITAPTESKELQSIYDLMSPSGTTTLNLQSYDQTAIQAELLKIASAAEVYSVQHDLTYPNSLKELVSSGALTDEYSSSIQYKLSADKLHFSIYTPKNAAGEKYLAYKSIDGKLLEMTLAEAEDVETRTISTPSQVLGLSTVGPRFNPFIFIGDSLKRISLSPFHF